MISKDDTMAYQTLFAKARYAANRFNLLAQSGQLNQESSEYCQVVVQEMKIELRSIVQELDNFLSTGIPIKY